MQLCVCACVRLIFYWVWICEFQEMLCFFFFNNEQITAAEHSYDFRDQGHFVEFSILVFHRKGNEI